MFSILPICPLPPGVNDAVVRTTVVYGEYRDETGDCRANGCLLRSGWESV